MSAAVVEHQTWQQFLEATNHKNLVCVCAVLFFSIFFYVIHLLFDRFFDKRYHDKISGDFYDQKYRNRSLKLRRSPSKSELLLDEMLATKESQPTPQEQLQQDVKRMKYVEKSTWTIKNLQISFLHSILCSAWLLHLLMVDASIWDDPFSYAALQGYLLLAFSSGYFLYDYYDIYVNGKLKDQWVVVVHHMVILTSFGYHMTHLVNIGYTAIALITEVNTVFLHARRLVRFYGYRHDHWLARSTLTINLVSFVAFRFGTMAYVFYGLNKDGHRMTESYLTMVSGGAYIMLLINIALFFQVLSSDYFSNWFKSQRSSSTATTSSADDTRSTARRSSKASRVVDHAANISLDAAPSMMMTSPASSMPFSIATDGPVLVDPVGAGADSIKKNH